MQFSNVPAYLRPREKAMKYGIASLTDYELLAIFLRTGSKELNVMALSQLIIDQVQGLANIKEDNLALIQEVKGIGPIKFLELQSLIELSKRLNQVNVKKYYYANNPEVICKLYQKRFEDLKQECFVVLALNAKNAIIDDKIIFIGSLSNSLVHLREIFKYIIQQSASSFICLHNHPSGDVTPSDNDLEVTHSLYDLSILLGIPLLDHIIVGHNKYYSFKQAALF
jgi:DNA repair protein RadC